MCFVDNILERPGNAERITKTGSTYIKKQSLNGIDRWGFVGRVEAVFRLEPDIEVKIFNQTEQLFVEFRAEILGHFLECAVQV